MSMTPERTKEEEQVRFEEGLRETMHVVLIDGDLPQGYRLREPVAVQVVLCDKSWYVRGRWLLLARGETEEEAIEAFKRFLITELEHWTGEEKTDSQPADSFSYTREILAYLRSIIIPQEQEER